MKAPCLAALLLAATPAASAAQLKLLYVPLDSGAVVRLFMADGRRETGRLLALFHPDSTRFVYCPGLRTRCDGVDRAAPRTLGVERVVRVETRRGHRAVMGAIVGLGVALGVTAGACALVEGLGCDPARGGFFSYAALPAGLGGAALGALIGSSLHVWAQAP